MRRLRSLRAIGRDRSATVAIEFAMAIPFLLVLMMGTTELFRFILIYKKTVQTANAMGEMLSSTQLPLKATDLQFVSDSGMIIVPQVLTDAQNRSVPWTSVLSSSYSSVVVTPTVPGCVTACSYKANVAWSAGPNRRACGTLSPAPDTASFSPTTLPQSLFRPGSVIVVDSRYSYQPVIASAIVKPVTITQSSFFVPRYVSKVTLGDMSSNPSLATQCPGY